MKTVLSYVAIVVVGFLVVTSESAALNPVVAQVGKSVAALLNGLN